jgi:hypothetical protein
MKMEVEEVKDIEMDASELLDLLDFDDDMWFELKLLLFKFYLKLLSL